MRNILRAVSACAAIALSCSAVAQSNFASLHGVVRDPHQQPVANASVVVTAEATGAARRLTTNPDGFYNAPALAAGEYTVAVTSSGMVTLRRNLTLEVGQSLDIDFQLQLSSVAQSVTVRGGSVIMDSTKTDVGEVIPPESIRNLPLNGRMILDLALTVPGTHMGSGAQTGDANPLYWRPGQGSAISIGGSRPNANYFLLDGATNTDPTFWTQNISLSPDAIQEFRVEASSYSADEGGAGGGQINIVTRSGTSHFHGALYEYLRNSIFDAHSFEQMGDANHLVQNQFGGSVGGPVLRARRTYFFANFEAYRHVQADTAIETVPTLDEINGDFSMSGVDVYNPDSYQMVDGKIVRDQFPDNKIPTEMLSPVAVQFMTKYLPRPNMMSMGGVDSNNYMDVRNERQNFNQGTLRIDHDFANGDVLFVRYSGSNESGFTPQNLPGFGAYNDNFAQQATASWNHIVSANLVNTTVLAASRLSMFRYSENNGVNDIVDELGIQGIGFGGKGAWGAPWFAVQGYSGFGDSFAATPVHDWDTVYEGRDTLFWQRGRHNLKFGASYRRYLWPMWGFFQNRGFYQFTKGFTTRTASNDGTGSALASFLLGLPAVRQRQAGIPVMDLRNWSADAYAQDEWRITTNTTINFGLRYEYSSPLWDAHYTNSNLDFSSRAPVAFIGGQGKYPNSLLFANHLNFAPRVGIAYHFPGAGVILRGAYGIFYTPVDFNTWCNQRHNVPFVFPETQQSDNFIPSINGFNFGPAVLGQTVVSFASFDPHAPPQHVQQWNATVEKSLGHATSVEVGYLGARGFHLQRAHLMNNAQPGPGAVQPRRPFQHISFVDGTELPASTQAVSMTFPVSAINQLENTAQSWYDAGYVNLRRRYSSGLSLLANFTFAKNLTNSPDFRSPMDESAIPQNNNNLAAEKGPACDIRERFVLSAVYAAPSYKRFTWTRIATEDWLFSTIYQAQSGFPFTVSVFGDTANAGTILGENPIRANLTGQPIFPHGTKNFQHWMNPAAFAAPAAYTFGDAGRNSVYGPGMRMMDLSVQRTISIRNEKPLIVQADFFNALNHTNLGTPNRFVNEPQFGSITMPMMPGREIQLSARYQF
ncbi:MAG TPA: carboxypeptidase regulatory-like domain-containing protein [Acidobacteriaceae bacterium]|nr:carboxypeptidase regulatory-like domain-containing protein [Acidobacteriaceae bacterium]